MPQVPVQPVKINGGVKMEPQSTQQSQPNSNNNMYPANVPFNNNVNHPNHRMYPFQQNQQQSQQTSYYPNQNAQYNNSSDYQNYNR